LASRLNGFANQLTLRNADLRDGSCIKSHTNKAELLALYRLAQECPPGANVVEIGSYLGASTAFLLAGLHRGNKGLVYCVDTWNNETMPEGQRDTYAEFQSNVRRWTEMTRVVRRASHEIDVGDLPPAVHLAFIDGDHSYLAVHNDIQKIAPLVVDDGVIAFHDVVAFQGVAVAVGELLVTGNWRFVGYIDNLVWLKKCHYMR
jgi:predicted O-methyltransferase YrrM